MPLMRYVQYTHDLYADRQQFKLHVASDYFVRLLLNFRYLIPLTFYSIVLTFGSIFN